MKFIVDFNFKVSSNKYWPLCNWHSSGEMEQYTLSLKMWIVPDFDALVILWGCLRYLIKYFSLLKSKFYNTVLKRSQFLIRKFSNTQIYIKYLSSKVEYANAYFLAERE